MEVIIENAAEFDRALTEAINEVPTLAADVYRAVLVRLGAAVIGGDSRYGLPGTPVDSGFARGSWVATLDQPSFSGPRTEADGVGASDLSAFAAASPGAAAYLVSMCVYMQRLEYDGWSGQAPDGFVRVALAAAPLMLRDLLAAPTFRTRRWQVV